MHVQQYLARDAGVHAVGHTLGDYVVCFDALVDVETFCSSAVLCHQETR